MCVERLSRWWPGIKLSSFCEPDVGSKNERLLRVPGWPERQDFSSNDGLRPTANNPSVHLQPRLGSRRILQVFQQYGYIHVEGSKFGIKYIPVRAKLSRKHRQLLLQILGEQFLFRRGRKSIQYEPLERTPDRLSAPNLMLENQPNFLGGG